MLRQPIRICEGLELSASEAATKTWGVLAFKGYGKTYLGGKLVEELYSAGAQQLILDEVGNWHGLRTSADGSGPGLSIPVLGGIRADLDVSAEQGERVAELLVETGGSAVLDVSLWRKNARRKFYTAFLETLYLQAKHKPRVRTLVCEEAQNIAPQMCKGDEKMLGAAIDCVRLGRNVGLGTVLLTQRPQSVSKECLNMSDPLMVGRMLGTQEIKAIEAWVKHVGADVKDELKQLQTLAKGEFFLWSPWLGKFERVKILPKRTLDASSTPTLEEFQDGLQSGVGPVVAPADSDLLKELTAGLSSKAQVSVPVSVPDLPDGFLTPDEHMARAQQLSAELEEWKRGAEVSADTIKALEAEVARLNGVAARALSLLEEAGALLRQSAQVARALKLEGAYFVPNPAPKPEEPCNRFPDGEHRLSLIGDGTLLRCLACGAEKHGPAGWFKAPDPMHPNGRCICGGEGKCRWCRATDAEWKRGSEASAANLNASVATDIVATLAPEQIPRGNGKGALPFGKAERAIMTVLVQHKGVVGLARLAALAGYHQKTKTFTNSLSSLSAGGFLVRQKGSEAQGFQATLQGRQAFQHVPALPRGAELLAHYKAALGKAGRLILEQLWSLGSTNGHTKELLAQRCGYHEKTKAFTNELSKLRSMGLVEKQGVFYRVTPEMR